MASLAKVRQELKAVTGWDQLQLKIEYVETVEKLDTEVLGNAVHLQYV